ncbi:hypothetical protein EmuJ_000111900 [Echinococcus multilocularis]|uniref:Uncharacterized protein n=1 Tax=Echinococcus multilocularis TaxID=6211 RepID=A0A087VYT5_ECHMU|nr:hypothetical protein EmuJ_000111900 [Echinococcus multilocularis]
MVAPNNAFGIRPCAVLLNNEDVVNYELQQKKYHFLAGVDLQCGQSTDKNVNEKSKKGLLIPDHKTKSYHVKKRKRERDMFYRRSIRLSRQGFLTHRRGTRRSVYFKLRRHLIENFRAGLVTKISCNNCYVKLTPLDLSNYIYTDSSDTATISTDGGSEGIANDSTSSQSSTISSNDEDPPNSPPSASYSRSRSAPGFGILYARSYLRCFKVRSGSQSLIGISGVKRGAMLLFNFLYLCIFKSPVLYPKGRSRKGRNSIASISSRSK